MSSHIKANGNCASQIKKVSVNHDLKINLKEVENIPYLHGETRLGCALCTKLNGGGCAITSLPGHFKRYCRNLGEELINKTKQKDNEYYLKKFGKSKKSEQEKQQGEKEEQEESEREESEEEESEEEEKILCECGDLINEEQCFLTIIKLCVKCVEKETISKIGVKKYLLFPPNRRRHISMLFKDRVSEYKWYNGRLLNIDSDKYYVKFDDGSVEVFECIKGQKQETECLLCLIQRHAMDSVLINQVIQVKKTRIYVLNTCGLFKVTRKKRLG